jgi:DNA primase
LQKLCEEPILLFDGDQAGEEAAMRALEALLSQGIAPQCIHLEGGEDPDSYLRRYGKLAFEKKIKSKRNLLEELIDKWSALIRQGPISIEKRGKTARQGLALINKIPDPIVQNLYRRRLAEGLEIPEEWLQSFIPVASNKKPLSSVQRQKQSWLPEEEILFEVWLKFPELRNEILTSVQVEDFCTEIAVQLATIFWQQAKSELHGKTGEYFDLAPQGLREVLSELSLRPDGMEEIETAQQSLKQAIPRLKEKRLRQDLQALRGLENYEGIHLIQEKVSALSQVIKNKERIYGESKE